MDINNHLRRTKAKLALFDHEGLNWLLHDIIQECRENGDPTTDEGRQDLIEGIRLHYIRLIGVLEKRDLKQTKLKL